MSVNNEKVPFKLLTNKWDKVKCKGWPRKSWIAQVEFYKKRIGSQDQVLDTKLIKKGLEKESVKSLKWAYNINPYCEIIRN